MTEWHQIYLSINFLERDASYDAGKSSEPNLSKIKKIAKTQIMQNKMSEEAKTRKEITSLIDKFL